MQRTESNNELRKSYETEMGDCVKNCKDASMTSTTMTLPKRRKLLLFENFDHDDSCPLSPCSVGKEMVSELRCCCGETALVGLSASFFSEDMTVSRCSRNYSSEVAKQRSRLVDLAANVFEIQNSAKMNGNFRSETTWTSPTSEVSGDAEETEHPATHRRKVPASKIPPQEEIQEFFAMAEERERKIFVEKYNYDIKRDLPLKGRFEWLPLKP